VLVLALGDVGRCWCNSRTLWKYNSDKINRNPTRHW